MGTSLHLQVLVDLSRLIRKHLWPSEVQKIMKDSKKGPLVEHRLIDNSSGVRPERDSMVLI